MTALLDIRDLTVRFGSGPGLLRRQSQWSEALKSVSLSVAAGETVGLVGESGSGKTTLARSVLGLVTPHTGTVSLGGEVIDARRKADRQRVRRDVQMVFQNPYSALNPTMTIGAALLEVLRRREGLDRTAAAARAAELLDSVRIPTSALGRYPSEFSGGQRQRLVIARALAARPKLLICDEPLSALDVSTQAEIINLLQRLKAETGTAYLFIGHDLAVIRHISDRVAVLYRGELVEEGDARQVYDAPAHPYTRRLLASVPEADPQAQRRKREERRALAERTG
ncbi:ABC transporter ATP-binding protein [Streptomyces phaeolivaceus]|uniref:ABC transporter ATP-binding protein n=1 Tax=Streptomyces phaeolivaceus TaxID=2653200 RepID=A0A5P8KEL8_9ACTN|nr:ATP-binding cassette domain-containing protein [Streptomyces phaeolivaceus]QFR01726.1 ABC transporter ATP-binding protein [Streptomyces phaeolivaceus]